MWKPQEQGGIVHDIITTQVIFIASKYTVIDITSSKCRFRDTVDNPNVRILVFVETIFARFVIQCVSIFVLKGHSSFS